MAARAKYQKLAPESMKALLAFDKTLANSPLDKTIIDLVKTRVSQINGCMFCLDIHCKEARLHGERELRLYHLPLWRESPLFTDKEKAALEVTELLTRPGPHGVDDADYAKLEVHFSEKEIADLTIAISSINAWNRLGIMFRTPPGTLDALMGLDKAGLK